MNGYGPSLSSGPVTWLTMFMLSPLILLVVAACLPFILVHGAIKACAK